VASGLLKLAGVDPSVREAARWCIDYAEGFGIPVTVVSGKRTTREQRRLWTNYQQCVATGRFGRTPECRYPANPPGESPHEFGLAWDSTVPEEYMDWWAAVRRYVGFHVIERDLPHAEVPNWRAYV
jgi:D-alanyl-D-alanine carboxypeptidase-like protein